MSSGISMILGYEPDGGQRERLWAYVRPLLERDFPDAEILVNGSDGLKGFNLAFARNRAVARATGDVLVLTDTDTIIPPAQVQDGLAALAEGAPWVRLWTKKLRLGRADTELILAGRDPWTCTPTLIGRWPWAAPLMIRRIDYHLVGGFDESLRLRSGRGEDTEFGRRADRRLGKHATIDGPVVHLWHAGPMNEKAT